MTAEEIIKKHGGEVIKRYSLISNWGYTVTYNGAEYDVRRWRNCYGSDGGWGVSFKDAGGDKEWMKAVGKDLNSDINSEW